MSLEVPANRTVSLDSLEAYSPASRLGYAS